MIKFRIFLHDYMTSFRTILIGFTMIIFLGAFVLSLPISSSSGNATNILDALFTATSATCVTGLVVEETATYWSTFGKVVIAILIQIGGLGVITIAIATLLFTGKRIGILERSTMKEAIGAPQFSGIVRLTIFILLTTLIFEGIGTLILAIPFVQDYGFMRGIGYAVFHSISAFCNAGIDIIGTGNTPSLVGYANHGLVNITIASLIVFGGLGFYTWQDLYTKHLHWKQFRLQTKIILSTTVVLIVLSFVYFYFVEFTNYHGFERILVSMFQAITPRTAGFNTANYAEMSEQGLFITILLMLIGGAPGSTAGGFKITTLFVLFAFTSSYVKRSEEVNCFNRRIEIRVVENAVAIIFLYFSILLIGAFFISFKEALPLSHIIFECASALGTVGLSTGITGMLGTTSKLVLICLMWFGRVGILTIAYATQQKAKAVHAKLPSEKIIVG